MKRNRAHGAGTLFLRGGTWQARWTFAGKQYQRSTGTGNRKEAERKLAEFTADFQRDGEAATLRRQSARLSGIEEARRAAEDARPALPLARLWDAYERSLARNPVADSTLERYAQRVDIFVRWMRRRFPDAVEVRAVTAAHAEDFMREVAALRSGKTFNDYRAILSQVWRVVAADASADARIEADPWTAIRRRPRDSATRRELSADELRRVMECATGEMRTLFAVGIYTGLRLGDAVRLDWSAVDLARGFIDATPAKTARHGTRVRIPVADALRAVLQETPPERRRGPLTPALAEAHARGAGAAFSERVQRVFRAAGIETRGETRKGRAAVAVGFHSLRHTFVSLCANGGVPLAVVQAIVGHTSAAMTRHYFHVADEALRGAAATLPDVTGPAPAPPAVDPPADERARRIAALEAELERLRAGV